MFYVAILANQAFAEAAFFVLGFDQGIFDCGVAVDLAVKGEFGIWIVVVFLLVLLGFFTAFVKEFSWWCGGFANANHGLAGRLLLF
jgi:hypothetical protein